MIKSEMERLMRAAIAEARRGMESGEVPIGCVLARESKGRVRIVARGFNKVNALQRKAAHAEIIAFENGGIQRGNDRPRLPLSATDVIMVSTLEPCVMCLGAAMEVGVKKVIFGLQAPADNGTHRVRAPKSPESSSPTIIGGILAEESRALLSSWLKQNPRTEQAKFVRQLLSLV